MSLKDVAKKVIDLELYSKPKVNNPYFLNNSKNSDTLMIILAGYKKLFGIMFLKELKIMYLKK